MASMRLIRIIGFVFFCGVFLVSDNAYNQSSSVILENDYLKYVISQDGKNLQFIDKSSGIDYCNHGAESFCASVKKSEREYKVTSVSYDGSHIKIEFAEAGVSALLLTIVHSNYIELEVISISGGDIEWFNFVNLPLTLNGRPGEPFGACVLSLNLITRVKQLPALQSQLWATCYGKFGLVGAKVAFIGVPQEQILEVLKKVIINADDLPKSTVSGPWARDIPFNRGSYLFNFGKLTEENVDDWIDMVKSLGFNQIDNHGGSANFFRWGDFKLNEEKWPQGWDNQKNIVARLHEAGIGSIFHTYCYYIDKNSKYVSPVPSPQLDAYRSFTLSEPLGIDDTEIHVIESTADVSTITGFFVNNSVSLHIGDEIITFSGVTREPPYKFTGCKRGLHGTKASAYPKGTKARHLKEILGLFVPQIESEIYKEILAKHAEIMNYCNFDGIYFDGIGANVMLGSSEDLWFYDTKFIYDLWKQLKKPVGMEYSSMSHHWWQFRSRWQAWDYPRRGHKHFTDMHVASVNSGLLVPLHLGWWNFIVWNPPQVEPTFPDVVEYMGCKLIGYDAGLSMTTAVDKETMREIPAFKRMANILKQYEELRHANYFDESIKKRLREPGKEFTLFQDTNGQWRFRPAKYEKHKVEGLNHTTSAWQTTNDFAKQPLKLRIEALMSAGAYNSPDNIILEDFSNPKNITEHVTAIGVTSDIQPSTDQVKKGNMSGLFTASSSGNISQNAAWVKAHKTFDPWLDLSKHQALGVWIYGDGNGELINFRLESPEHVAYGAVADHYMIVDFKGWRYFELIETESTRWSEYRWSDGKWLYNVYRELIHFDTIESLSIWYNNLPPNKKVKCYLSPIKAIPMVQIKIKNPAITIGGKTIVFPVEMESGSYLEFNSMSDCKLYSPKGKLLVEVTPGGDIPILQNGANKVDFSCDDSTDISVRANVTIISNGEPL